MIPGTSWVAPNRGASVALLLAAVIQNLEPGHEREAYLLIRKYWTRDRWNTRKTSLALNGWTLQGRDLGRIATAIRRVVDEQPNFRAGVAELEYAPVSKTGPVRVAGSNPAPGTNHTNGGR